jgi:hypothetical protein
MDYETLLYEQRGHVVTLVHNRPQQHNAINRIMSTELRHAWQRFRDDDEAFVLILTGAGDTTFCAGWDLAEAAELTTLGDYDRHRRDLYNSPGSAATHARSMSSSRSSRPSMGMPLLLVWRLRSWLTSASPPRTPNSVRWRDDGTSSPGTD